MRRSRGDRSASSTVGDGWVGVCGEEEDTAVLKRGTPFGRPDGSRALREHGAAVRLRGWGARCSGVVAGSGL